MLKVAIWGLGKEYNYIYNILKYFEYKQKISIAGLVDLNAYMDELDGYKVVKPPRLHELDYDYIIVASENRYNDIVYMATTEHGVSRDRLLTYKILFIPNIDLDSYIELYNSKVTIISNNCWGGCAYNTLGMECLSPFKNLFVLEEDYLKLINNLEYYMDFQPVFNHYSEDVHSRDRYPVLKIKDIEIHCNHTSNIEDAIDDWNRRRIKINYDNLFFEMYTLDREVANKFVELTKGKKSVCFVPWKSFDEKLITLEMSPRHKEFYEAVNTNATIDSQGLKYNLVDLLQGRNVYRY